MKKTLMLMTVLGILLVAGPAWSQPLADRLPEGSIAYFGWAGRSPAFDGSMTGQLLAEPGLAELLGNINKAVAASLAQDPQKQEAFQAAWSMASIAWQKPCAAAVFDVKVLVVKLPDGHRVGGPQFTGAVLVELGKDRAAFDEQLQKLLAALAPAATQPTAVRRPYTVISQTPVGPLACGYAGDMFFLAVGDGAPETVLALADGKGKSLAQRPSFREAMKDVCRENVQSAYFVDVTRVYALAAAVTTQPATAATMPATFPAGRPGKIIRALGLENVTVVAGATSIVDKGLYGRFRCFSPAPHHGLLSLAGKPLGEKAFDGVPGDAMFLATMNLSPAEVLNEIRLGLMAVDFKAAMRMQAIMDAAGAAVGLDIEKDLLSAVGDQWTIYSAPSVGGVLTGTVLVAQLKDVERFKQAQAKLEAFAGAQLGGGGPKAAGLHAYRSGQTEIHYLRLAGPISLVAPAWAVHGDRLYLAGWPQVVEAAISGTAEKPLADRADFAALRKRLSPDASAIIYVELAPIARQCYNIGLVLSAMAGNLLPGEWRGVVTPHTLPALPTVEKYLWPYMTALSSDAKGVVIESYGSLPGIGLVGVSPTNLAVGAILLGWK